MQSGSQEAFGRLTSIKFFYIQKMKSVRELIKWVANGVKLAD